MLNDLLIKLENLLESIETVKKIIQTLKKLWKVIEYVITLVFLFIIILQIEFLRNGILDLINNTFWDGVIVWSYDHTNIVLFILFSMLIVAYLYKIRKIGKGKVLENEVHEKFVEQLHERFIHDVRDNVKELDEESLILNSTNEQTQKVTKKKMYQALANNLQKYVDFIAELLTKYCATTVSVCIKIVKFENEDLQNPLATTLARSSNTRKSRLKEDETVKVNDNEDFKYLYKGANTFYGKANLVQEHQEGHYHVSESMDVWSKKYNSTLIVPIRYYSKHSSHNNINMEFDILGFLCIDAQKNMEQWEKINSYELNVLAVFADTMYIYLKKFKEVYCKS